MPGVQLVFFKKKTAQRWTWNSSHDRTKMKLTSNSPTRKKKIMKAVSVLTRVSVSSENQIVWMEICSNKEKHRMLKKLIFKKLLGQTMNHLSKISWKITNKNPTNMQHQLSEWPHNWDHETMMKKEWKRTIIYTDSIPSQGTSKRT